MLGCLLECFALVDDDDDDDEDDDEDEDEDAEEKERYIARHLLNKMVILGEGDATQ